MTGNGTPNEYDVVNVKRYITHEIGQSYSDMFGTSASSQNTVVKVYEMKDGKRIIMYETH